MKTILTTVDKKEYLVIIRDNYCQFCTKSYVVTPHLNHLNEMVQMRGHTIMVSMRKKIKCPSDIFRYSSYLELCILSIFAVGND